MRGNSLVVREPVGVVASFPAYNFAFAAVGQKLGPALIAGCTAVLKVTEPNPLATFVYGEIFEEAGLPPGVVNIVAAAADESAYLVRHPGVDMVSFTGSDDVGSKVAAACGALVRPCVLELGGNPRRSCSMMRSWKMSYPCWSAAASAPTLARSVSRRAGSSCRPSSTRLLRGARRSVLVIEGRRPDGGGHGGRPACIRQAA